MAEEPTLPRLPAVTWDERSQSFNNTRKRGRRRLGAPSLASNSSDPAVFSSDDDPAVENYATPRRKKRYVGSWFHQQPAASSDSALGDTPDNAPDTDDNASQPLPRPPRRKKKRPFERQLDSGVWMGGSEDAADDMDDEMSDICAPAQTRLAKLHLSPPRPPRAPQVSPLHNHVRSVIQRCVDEGDENVDLSTMDLQEIPNSVIEPLSGFSCIPVVAKEVAFMPRDPSLKLFLANNKLQTVPGAVFDLEYLTVLSLRANQLTELPPGIGRLKNLVELNVSQNFLRWLPAELLELLKPDSKLKSLRVHPNKFYNPFPIYSGADEEAERHMSQQLTGDELPVTKLISWPMQRSPVQYSDTAGQVHSHFRLAPKWAASSVVETEPFEKAPELPSAGASRHASKVPSLLELALQACGKHPQLDEFPSLMPQDGPPHLPRLLASTILNRHIGGRECSICKRKMQVPLTQWVEWQVLLQMTARESADGVPIIHCNTFCGDSEGREAIPFMFRGCSWRCLPQTRKNISN